MGTTRSVTSQKRTPVLEPHEIASAAALDVPVLVSAANAAERSTYARLLHARSNRSDQPFIDISCDNRRDEWSRPCPLTIDDLRTAVLRARGGTLYLDDVGALNIICQTWLCSHLTREMTTHRVRVISGSDGTLATLVADGSFEAFLFYRLNVIHIDRT